MAGVYPDFPARRLAYDVDGTQFYHVVNGAPALQTQAQMQYMNDEDSTDGFVVGNYSNGQTFYNAFVFPVATNIVAYHLVRGTGSGTGDPQAVYYNGTSSVETSLDTTDGNNGTWTQVLASVAEASSIPAWRDGITAISGGAGIRGIRFRHTKNSSNTANHVISSLGLYGDPTALPAALHFWHPTLDQQLGKGDLDLGDVVPGQIITRTFRIKNTTAQAANNVQMSAYTPTGVMGNTIEFSADGTNYTPNLTVTSIAAGAISSVYTMRRTVQSTGVSPGKYACRIQAIAGSWT